PLPVDRAGNRGAPRGAGGRAHSLRRLPRGDGRSRDGVLDPHQGEARMSRVGVVEAAGRLFGLALIRRELIGLLRTPRAFWLLVVIVGFSGLLPIFNWPTNGSFKRAFSPTPLLLTFFLNVQLTLALLVIPAFTAGAISGERERGTYDLLYSTLLSP